MGPENPALACPLDTVNLLMEQVLMRYYGHVHHQDGMYGYVRPPTDYRRGTHHGQYPIYP